MLYTIITCSFLHIIRRVIGGWRLNDFGLRLSKVKEAIIRGVVVPAPLFVIQCVAALIAIDYILAQMKEYLGNMDFYTALLLAFIGYPLLTILWTSFHEEFRFRGYMQGLLEECMDSTVALIAVAIFFAYSHFWVYMRFSLSPLMLLASLTYILLPALILGLEYTAYKNIIVTITTHTICDAISVWITITYYYQRVIEGTTFTIILIAVFAILAYIKRQEIIEFKNLCQRKLASNRTSIIVGIVIGAYLLAITYTLNTYIKQTLS